MRGLTKYFSVAFVAAFAVVMVNMLCAGSANAQATDARVKAAMKLVDLGNARQAVTDLQQLTASDPKNAEAHAGLAIALLNMNNVAAAAPEAQAGFDIDRRNVLVRVARGMVYGRQGKQQDALDEFNAALKQNPNEIGSYLALSRYYLSIDSLKPAEVILYRAQQINDKDVRSYIGLAELYERQHIQALAISQYNQALKLAPTDVTVMAQLASMYYRAGRYDESANEWLNILRVDSTYADAYYQVGNLYYLAKQYQNSAAYANRYVQLKPDDIYGQWLLAKSLTELGDYKQALPALEKVSTNDSLRALAQPLLARGYYYSRDYPKAISLFKQSTNLTPLDLNYYGLSLIVSGDTTNGVQQLEQSLQNDTSRTAQQKLEARTLIGRLLYAQKRYPESAQAFAEIADANPSIDWDMTAGQIYATAKQPEKAQEYYNRALAIDSNSVKVRYQMAMDKSADLSSDDALNAFDRLAAAAKLRGSTDTLGIAEGYLGYHYAGKKEWSKAADQLEASVKDLKSGSPYLENFYVLLAQSDLQTKDFARAQDAIDKAVKINPNNKSAKEIEDYLTKVKESQHSSKGGAKKK